MQLTDHEKMAIVSALAAVAPTGGGSTPYHLSTRLRREWGIDYDAVEVEQRRHIMTVLDDAAECGAITIHERLEA